MALIGLLCILSLVMSAISFLATNHQEEELEKLKKQLKEKKCL